MRQIARRSLVAMVAVAAALAVAPPASAQLVNPFGKTAASSALSKEDMTLMRTAMRDALNEYKVGATRTWSSPKSKRAGKATVTKLFEQGGMKCAQLTHEFTEGPGNNYTAPLCKVKDGTWKLAF